MSPQDIMWWSTFNAALTGIMAIDSETWSDRDPLRSAWGFAFVAHGITPDSYQGPWGEKS